MSDKNFQKVCVNGQTKKGIGIKWIPIQRIKMHANGNRITSMVMFSKPEEF